MIEMDGTRLFLLTGATSGMGLALARILAGDPHNRLIIGARAPASARATAAIGPAERVTVLALDLSSLSSVRDFTAAVSARLGPDGSLDGMACNAGVQIPGPLRTTADGIELTFASNHLGHFAIVHALLDRLRMAAPVISTASGTHDPADTLARRFGFRGGIFPCADAVVRGQLDGSVPQLQQGMDRYATSKLCNILFTYEMARRIPADRARFIAFDPGLMPGTGLARERSAAERFGWRYVLPILGMVVDGVSTAARSAHALATLLTDPSRAPGSGLHLDFTLRPIASSRDSYRQDWAQDLYDVSARLARVAHPVPAAA